ncbi:hypothetical protein KCP77_12820 [Salmonella enterica subsp. enterica]|nr:hypothetical protein KCP77_12820 [Salmonella enterica subsp. enterica]
MASGLGAYRTMTPLVMTTSVTAKWQRGDGRSTYRITTTEEDMIEHQTHWPKRAPEPHSGCIPAAAMRLKITG